MRRRALSRALKRVAERLFYCGRPDHQELVRQLRGAPGMYPGGMPISPQENLQGRRAMADIEGADGPLTTPDAQVMDELVAEIERLRAAQEHLLQFVIQKCPQCGIVIAPEHGGADG
jgi:hypothetical protein